VEATVGRHHRTALLLGALTGLTPRSATELLERLVFRISADAEACSTRHGQAAVLTAVNVLARTGGALQVHVPAIPSLLDTMPWRGRLDEISALVAVWAGGRISDAPASAAIHVGRGSASSAILINGDTWNAWVDMQPTLSGLDHGSLGAIIAAHLGCARAFHAAMATELDLPPVDRNGARLSLLNGPNASVREVGLTELPNFTLVGAGAVGHALLWAITAGGYAVNEGPVVFDPQVLDETNLNRHLLAGTSDVGRAKADVASAFARQAARNISARVEKFVPLPSPTDVIVSTVDNDDARYQVQGSLPRLLLHGATTREVAAVAALDIAQGACLGCLFPRPTRSPAETIAAETGLQSATVAELLEGDGALTAEHLPPIAARLGVNIDSLHSLVGLPFRVAYARELCGRLRVGFQPNAPAPTVAYVSGLAGTLLAAELAKLSDPRLAPHRLVNYLQIAAPHPQSAWATQRAKQDDCPLMCSSPALQGVITSLRAGAE
jgi:molybdopterin/thiamine biosynthesis adenylyltransferase